MYAWTAAAIHLLSLANFQAPGMIRRRRTTRHFAHHPALAGAVKPHIVQTGLVTTCTIINHQTKQQTKSQELDTLLATGLWFRFFEISTTTAHTVERVFSHIIGKFRNPAADRGKATGGKNECIVL
ncbi:hypothetical protein B0H13DRAFT_1863473 [Mycena leptocephala]|nr:hypothetical protein B0H13DRAFT_1863473 [Mycena leptocephala]